jgi:GNAT superfamily N-acetyltransferase
MGKNGIHEGLLYRLATVEDMDLLLHTRVDFFDDMLSGITESEKEDVITLNRPYLEEAIKDGGFTAYLAFDGDILVATSGMVIYRLPPSPRNRTGKVGYILNMYTKPEYRGKGIATHLFDLTVEEARERGCGKVSLHATAMGRPIYEKYGFTVPPNAMEYGL